MRIHKQGQAKTSNFAFVSNVFFFFYLSLCFMFLVKLQKLKVSKWTRRRVSLQDKVVRASHCGKCKHKTIEEHFACLWRSSGTLGRYRSSVIFVAFVWLTACHLGANCALTKLIARIFVTFLVQTATFKLKDFPVKGRVINWVNLASEYGVGDWRVCAFNCFWTWAFTTGFCTATTITRDRESFDKERYTHKGYNQGLHFQPILKTTFSTINSNRKWFRR